MTKEFVPYELALRMKQLGFNEQCFRYEAVKKICENQAQPGGCQLPNVHCGYPACTIDSSVESLPIPVWQQAFRWFREKHKLSSIISQFGYSIENQFGQIIHTIPDDENPLCYEEAELACLEKLLEIVESKSE